jgi:hypothetical protein
MRDPKSTNSIVQATRTSPRHSPPHRFGHHCAWPGCSASARCEACRFRGRAGWVCVLADARLDLVARVDPDDDNLRRYVVHHYRYDPVRHERRHVVVAAFDSRREFSACLDAVSEEIRRRRAAGGHVDPSEHVSGIVYEPGSRRRAANGRLVMRALSHGVAPGPWMDELELPSNMAVFGASARPGHQQARLGRLIRRWLASRRYYRLRRPGTGMGGQGS